LESFMVFQFMVNSAVQHGVATAIRLAQRACQFPSGEQDAVLGPKTRAAILSHGDFFLAPLIAERCKYYAAIMSRDPTQRVFASGWLNRIAKDLL
jgi:lysozyme family protein